MALHRDLAEPIGVVRHGHHRDRDRDRGHRRRHRSRLTAVAAVVGAVTLAVPAGAVQAADLSDVTLEASDLPSGFVEVPDDVLAEFDSSAKQIGESMEASFEEARLQQFAVYASDDDSELIEVVVVGPLVAAELAGIRFGLADPGEFADQVMPSFVMWVDLGPPVPLDTSGIGEASAGFTYESTVSSDSVQVTNPLGFPFTEQTTQFLLGVRGDYLFVVATSHAGPGDARIDLLAAAHQVDVRLAAALGIAGPGRFRPTDTFSPEVATGIPTLTDVSTDPRVVGANLVLAAVAVLAMTLGMRLLNTTLVAHEDALEHLLRPARAVGRWWARADDAIGRHASRWAGAIRAGGVLLFYGVLFSFLERGWRPWTLSGLFVLVAMTIAFGVVGTLDDMVELRSARRWGLPARLAVKPALVLIAIGSVVLTKVAGLVPGLMIGTPEAFSLEDDAGERDELRLARVGLGVTAGVGLGAWALAAPVGAAFDGGGGFVQALLGATATVLVLVFAVAVENLFANLLAFPGSEGASLRRSSAPLWWICMLAVTALFFHTLVNPSGELAESLESTNVRVVLATVALFLAATVAIRVVFSRRDRAAAAPPVAPAPVAPAAVQPATVQPATVLPPPVVAPAPPPPPPPPAPTPAARRPRRERHPVRTVRRVLGVAMLVALVAAVVTVVVQRQRDRDLYDAGHTSYLRGDCATAVAEFDELLARSRLVDDAGVTTPASIEWAECTDLLAVDQLAATDPPAALLAYSGFVAAHPGTDLAVAVNTRAAALVDSAGAAAVVSVTTCEQLDQIATGSVLPAATVDDVTLGCAVAFDAAGRSDEAWALTLDVLARSVDPDTVERATGLALASPAACTSFDQLLTATDLAASGELEPALQDCMTATTVTGDGASLARLQLAYLSLLPELPAAETVAAAMLANPEACDLMDEVRADPAVAGREGFLASFTFGCAQIAEYTGDWAHAVEWYQWFLDNVPLEPRSATALDGLARSTVAAAEGSGAGSLPAPAPAGGSGSPDAEVVIYNDTPDELRIVVSGPESRIAVIPASPTSSYYSVVGPTSCRTDVPSLELDLTAGTYDVLVETTTAADVDDFLGSWELDAYDAYQSCFFIVTTFG